MRFALIVFFVAQTQLINAAISGPKSRALRPRQSKPINWNDSYYSEPFAPCKYLKKYNPVEQARVHGIAVDVYRKCGPKLVIPYATKYRFPSFGE